MADQKKDSIKERVAQVIDAIRPAIQMDGGDVELVSVGENGVVAVRLHGACVGCPAANMTLKMGLERNVNEKVPEITYVVCV